MKFKLATFMQKDVDHIKTGLMARNMRVVRKLSLREVARRMDISAPFLSDLERGRRNWNNRLADSFYQALKNK